MQVYALGSPLGVALSGALDRRLVLLSGLGVFALAALVASLATSLEVLLLARVLGAFGAGLLVAGSRTPSAGRQRL